MENIETATPSQLKQAYSQDYKTPAERRKHVHPQVIRIVDQTERISGVPELYPVVDFTVLSNKGCWNVSNFLLDSFKAAGVRPDTPFHQNNEQKYLVSLDSYRYVEYNVIGGGMRLIYDSKKGHLFLSCHYSAPALITASGAGSAEATGLAEFKQGLKKTHKNLKDHSEGKYQGADRNTQHLEALARGDPAFQAWLTNKNSRQSVETLQAYGLR
jgi:hypothetical protein